MTIALTGATGSLGRLVVDSLITRGTPTGDIVAIVRDAQKAAFLADKGVQVRVAEYGDVPALTAALEGVDRLLLISASEPGKRLPQHQSVIDAAKAAGVKFLAYTSISQADTTEHLLAPEHKATEAAIRESGIPFAFLRNNWYTENYLGDLDTADKSGTLLTSAADGRVASASRADYADAAAVVLAGPGFDGQVYELAGDTAWTFTDLAAAFAEVLGKPVELVNVSSGEHVEKLKSFGLDEGTAGFVAGLNQNIADGTLATSTTHISDLTGRPTTPLVEGLRAASGR